MTTQKYAVTPRCLNGNVTGKVGDTHLAWLRTRLWGLPMHKPVTMPVQGQPQGGEGLRRMGKAPTVKTKGARASQVRWDRGLSGVLAACSWSNEAHVDRTKKIAGIAETTGFSASPWFKPSLIPRLNGTVPNPPAGSSISTPPPRSLSWIHLEDIFTEDVLLLLFDDIPTCKSKTSSRSLWKPHLSQGKAQASLLANPPLGDRTRQMRPPADISFAEAPTIPGRSQCQTSAFKRWKESRLLSAAQRPSLCC